MVTEEEEERKKTQLKSLYRSYLLFLISLFRNLSVVLILLFLYQKQFGIYNCVLFNFHLLQLCRNEFVL